MSMGVEERPDYVHCIQHGHVTRKGSSWCGRELEEWHFVDVDHAALNGEQGGRLQACPECSNAVIAALTKGTWWPK